MIKVLKRVDNNKTTQIPNNLLNTKVLENITRSGCMKEQLSIAVNFDTSFEDIQKLKHELLLFAKENSRDFQPDLEVEVFGISDLDKLVLRIEMRHRSNWANESLMLARRNRFMLALVSILRRIPIYAPGGGFVSALVLVLLTPFWFTARLNIPIFLVIRPWASKGSQCTRWQCPTRPHETT